MLNADLNLWGPLWYGIALIAGLIGIWYGAIYIACQWAVIVAVWQGKMGSMGRLWAKTVYCRNNAIMGLVIAIVVAGIRYEFFENP